MTVNMIHCMIGDYRWLSNYHLCAVHTDDGLQYTSSEAAYQAQKLESVEERKRFMTMTPSESKKEGKLVPLPSDWDSKRVHAMYMCLYSKFSSLNPELVDKLLATGESIIQEGNWWKDSFWGVTYPTKQDCLDNTNVIGGGNMLGRLIMHRRWHLQHPSKVGDTLAGGYV